MLNTKPTNTTLSFFSPRYYGISVVKVVEGVGQTEASRRRKRDSNWGVRVVPLVASHAPQCSLCHGFAAVFSSPPLSRLGVWFIAAFLLAQTSLAICFSTGCISKPFYANPRDYWVWKSQEISSFKTLTPPYMISTTTSELNSLNEIFFFFFQL